MFSVARLPSRRRWKGRFRLFDTCLGVYLMLSIFVAAIFDGPQVLIAEEEKIILEEARDNQIVVEEKLVVNEFIKACCFLTFDDHGGCRYCRDCFAQLCFYDYYSNVIYNFSSLRTLVDTVYSLRDQVKELKQVFIKL